MDRPKEPSRGAEAVIPEADRQKLRAFASPAFKKVLTVLHGTGGQPGGAAGIEAKGLRDGVVVLTVHKSEGTGRPRLVAVRPKPSDC